MKLSNIAPKNILISTIVVFVAYFTFVAICRHDNFYSRRLDLGNMDQTVWNVAHGNGFVLTDPMGETSQSRLAIHADFLLFLFAPLYTIWSSPKVLLIIQVIVIGIGAIPLYWIAKEKLGSDKLGLLFSSAYLLYPAIQRNVLHDFHAVSLSTSFLLFAYWYMEKKNGLLFIIFALLAGLGKEDIWLIVGIMGLYMMVKQKLYIVGSGVAIGSFFAFYYLFWHAIPTARLGGEHFALSYLSEFGTSQNEILFTMIRSPFRVLGIFIAPDRLMYYFLLLTPLGYLPLFSPAALIFALPDLMINVLSSNDLMRHIDYQYNSSIVPFIFIAAVNGYKSFTKIVHSLEKKHHEIKKYSLSVSWIILTVLLSLYLWGNLPWGRWSWFWTFVSPPPEKSEMQRVEQLIDSKHSVSATNNIGAHFSERKELFNFPVSAESADYSVVYLGDPYAWPSGSAQEDAIARLMKNPMYELIASQSAFYAFRKKGL